MRKSITILTIFLLFPAILFSQDVVLRDFHKNWRAGGAVGVSYLAMELKKDFRQATMDMNSQPNATFSFYAYKRFTKNIETGIEYEKCFFSGFKNYSSNVNWLVYDKLFNNDISHFLGTPIYYNTDISTWYLNLNYNFLNLYSLKNNFLNINFYVKAGIGFSLIGVELGYRNSNDYLLSNLKEPLFEKGQGNHPQRDSYGTFHSGIGFNYYLSNRLSFSVEGILLFVSADYLDGVHNYSVTHNSNGPINYTRVGVFDTVGEIKICASYHFDLYSSFKKVNGEWVATKRTFVNDFFYNKKYNRIIKPTNPYSNEDLMKTIQKRKGKIRR